MLSTNDRAIYERAIAFCHHERIRDVIREPGLRDIAGRDGFRTGLPLGGLKGRINQTCSATGLVQLRDYQRRIAEMQGAMNRFWDELDGCPGLRAHRIPDSGSTMGGWYNPLGHYFPEELGGLPVERFIDAVAAEGVPCARTCDFPLHEHPVLNDADVFHDGRPTRIAWADRDLRQSPESLPVSHRIAKRCFGVPSFKVDRPQEIRRYASAFRKVVEHADRLLDA